jgi:hypothetical protein
VLIFDGYIKCKEITIFSIYKVLKNYTLSAFLLSLILIALFIWWFQGGWILSSIYAAVSIIALLSVPVMYRLMGYTNADDVRWLEQQEQDEHRQLLARIALSKKELNDLELDEAVHQADVLSKIIKDYHSVVETRFLGKKHSPMTYLSAARTVQRTASQNLTDMVAIGHSIATIKRNKLDQAQINNDAVQQRQDKQAVLYQEQSKRLDDLLEENRKLFNALMETAVEVANIKSFNQFERLDTLSRLVSLAEIAKKTEKIHLP